ncbi:hypothetical protein [Oligoflexus tunisiensis]|uniref:hypothetical protein n=1 Tax=Oligoflexus tunisiensis TaxID=708132 RepID=UPI00114C8DED|nr:hypothetical protein [Oligoflexus tunisiensis]
MVFPRLLRVLGFLCLSVLSPSGLYANGLQKLSCTDAEALETKCKAYDAETKACEVQAQAEGKAQIDAAKKAQDECKKKHSFNYVVKCQSEIKKATALVNTPKPALKMKVQKDLETKPESACAKAAAIGREQALCKGPKKVIATAKSNCIKDM